MVAAYSSFLALRAVIVVFIRRTLGLTLLIITVVALFIAILSAYNAMHGVWLLWIIFTIAGLSALLAAVLGAAVYLITGKIMPRKLSPVESKQIRSFSGSLQHRLVLARAPLPVFIFKLFVHVLLREDHSRQQAHLENTIDDSRQLSAEFKRIRGFFE